MARKILLADDSVTAQNMGRKILTDAGYDVITVNNGSAALKRVAEHKPDLIVLDVYMPGYSGLEVCQRLKDSPETSRVPILLTVGKLEPFKPEEARRVNADAFIVKPFEASELLSALTRLEDRMVPHSGGSNAVIERFGGDGSSRKSEDTDSDTGWKSRLRFPSKKKVEEPEPEPETDFVTTPFRDQRRGSAKSVAPSVAHPAAVHAAAPAVVPDIPRDITPEELDALSAVAAKLDVVPAAETSALPEAASQVETPHAAVEAEVVPPPTETPVAEAQPIETAAVVETQPAESALIETIAGSEIPTAIVSAVESPADAEAEPSKSAIEANRIEAIQADAAAYSSPLDGLPTTESAIAEAESAPIDRNDEPMFASAASATAEQSIQESAEKKELPPAAAEINASVEAESEVQPRAEESKPEEPKAEEAPKVEETREPVAVEATAESASESETAPPSEEELAEALRLLTPSHGTGDTTVPATHEELAAAGAVLAGEVARNAGAGRWVAESVALSPEEASLSLEAEMFGRISGPSTESGSAPATDAPSANAPAVEDTVVESAAPSAEVPAESVPEAPALEATTQAITDSVAASEKVEAERKAAEAAEAPVEESASATFADAIRHEHEEEQSASTETEMTPAAAQQEEKAPLVEESQISSSETAEGEDSMGTKGKSNWHQIHSASAPAAAKTDVVEEAKQAEAPAEESSKAMAAAASADGSDSSSIASIVDSVLADLKPRIVEEIAKKLAKK